MKKEIWYGDKNIIIVFGFCKKNSSMLDSTLIFFVERPQMAKSGKKGKGC